MDWSEVSAVAALCVVGSMVAGYFVGYGQTKGKIDQVAQDAAETKARVDSISADFSAYKEASANRFVTQDMIEKFEVKMFDAVERMGTRLDSVIGRMADRLDRVLEGRKP